MPALNFIQVKETCFYSKDLEKVWLFYHGLLGLPVMSYVADKHVFFKVGTSVLLCFNPEDSKKKKSPPPHFGEGKLHFAFEVKPAEYEYHKIQIEMSGIPIIDKVIWETGQESFYFNDPEGNVLEIVPEGIWN